MVVCDFFCALATTYYFFATRFPSWWFWNQPDTDRNPSVVALLLDSSVNSRKLPVGVYFLICETSRLVLVLTSEVCGLVIYVSVCVDRYVHWCVQEGGGAEADATVSSHSHSI